MKILVIDDERGSHEVVKAIYGEEVIISVYNGEEGIEAIKKHNPDAILLDIMMPIYSGEDVLEYFRKDKKILRKIVTITGSADGVSLASKYGTGGNIWKPFNRNQLKKVVQRILNGRKKREKDQDKNKKLEMQKAK